MSLNVNQRRHIKSENFGLPRKRKFPINTEKRAVAAVAYAKKGAREGTITPKERDIVLRKVHQKYPDINITPIRHRG